jgi:myo-inositol-1(or 4)-monophosphatase
MLKTARKASRMLVRDYGEICNLQSSLRNIDSFVETSKSKITTNLIKDLSVARPDYSIIIDSENYQTKESSYSWIINPIDGLVNFTHGLPNFAVSIGLTKKIKNDEIENVAVVIDAPILNETYFSEKNSGAWLEKHSESSGSNFRLRVSARNVINGALIAKIGNIDFDDKNAHVRLDGTSCLALAYLASGRYDVVIGEKKKLLNNVATLLLYEAGGVIKGSSSNLTQFIASNNSMIKLFLE